MYQDGVTIAIPNWNHEFFLPRSVRSALDGVRHLRAGGVEAEVLVVDDASRDGSIPLLRTLEALYFEDGLRCLALEQNSGLAHARNLALTESRYRHVVFMDADNELIGSNLPRFYAAIRETGAAAVYGNLLIRKLGYDDAYRVCSNESVQSKLYDMNYIDAFALFDRNQLLDAGGYASTLPAHEDWELWLHLASTGRQVVFVPLAFGRYFELPNSMIRTVEGGERLHAKSGRMFNQTGFRHTMPPATVLARYLPGVGYL